MIQLNEENTALFGEQVGDHVAKLNEMMGHTSGESFRDRIYRKTCFANRLLEGSTRMLGLDEWSRTLGMFASLLARVTESTGCWDENISQIVSEILETEESLVEGILSGSIEETATEETFAGLQKEIQVLLEEGYARKENVERQFEEIGGLSLDNGEAQDEQSVSTAIEIEEGRVRAGGEPSAKFGTLERLVHSLERVNARYLEYIAAPEKDSVLIRDLEISYGESEFFLGLVGNILRQLDDSGRQFRAKVPSGTVLEGVEEFIAMNSRLRGWDVKLGMQADNFSLEREAASALALIMECMILDVCRMHEEESHSLQIDVEVENEGSFLVATLRDNGKAWLSDSEIDRDDAVAFYRGLLRVRGMLKDWGCLLWVEPGRGNEGRFRFTFPRTTVITDYLLLHAGEMRIAVPSRAVEAVFRKGEIETEIVGGQQHAVLEGEKVPVCRIDELAADEIDPLESSDCVVFLGLAEKRLGLRVSEAGQKVEGIVDQLTGGEWAGMVREVLHIGDLELPVLDTGLVLDKYASVLGLDSPMEESGFSAAEDGTEDTVIDRISRV